MYKWIAAKSELQTESELEGKTLGYNSLSAYNSLLAIIHLYMIQSLVYSKL